MLVDTKFVQVLEGAEDKLSRLMQCIQADDRHERVTILGEWPIKDRLFSGWGMARPDPTTLSEQAFRIVTESGTGAKVT